MPPIDPCKPLHDYLHGQPRELSPDDRETLQTHLVACPECAAELIRDQAHQAHLEQLSPSLDKPSDERSINLVAAVHHDFLDIGQRILDNGAALRQRLERYPAPRGTERYFWGDAPPHEQYAALAVVEAALSLGTLLANQEEGDGGNLSRSELHLDEGRLVPSSYFHALVARRCGVDTSDGQQLWEGIVSFLINAGRGLPGVHVEEATAEVVRLIPVNEPVN